MPAYRPTLLATFVAGSLALSAAAAPPPAGAPTGYAVPAVPAVSAGSAGSDEAGSAPAGYPAGHPTADDAALVSVPRDGTGTEDPRVAGPPTALALAALATVLVVLGLRVTAASRFPLRPPVAGP